MRELKLMNLIYYLNDKKYFIAFKEQNKKENFHFHKFEFENLKDVDKFIDIILNSYYKDKGFIKDLIKEKNFIKLNILKKKENKNSELNKEKFLNLCKDLNCHFQFYFLKDEEIINENKKIINYFGEIFIPGFKI